MSIQLLLHHRDLDYDIVNIGSGRAWSVNDLIQVISTILRWKIEVLCGPKRLRPVDRPVLCADADRLFKSYSCVLQDKLKTALRELFGGLCKSDRVAARADATSTYPGSGRLLKSDSW